MTRVCNIKDCENTLSPRSKLPSCATCRGNMGSWRRRKPHEIIIRVRRLSKYQDRMSYLLKQDKVIIMKRRKSNVR